MSSRHRRHRADVAAFRRCGDDLLVDLFDAALKQRTLTFYEAGSYARGMAAGV